MSDSALASYPECASASASPLSAARRWRLAVYAASTVLCVVWTLVQGRDLNPDALQYHFYSGFSAVHDRFSADFLAAGPQGYFTPYAYVPFYLMVASDVPAVVIGVALALMQSTLLWATYELAIAAKVQFDARTGWIGALAVGLAASNPVLLQSIGSSSTDLSTGALAVFAWALLIKNLRHGGVRLAVIAGALAGMAAGLKLSNAIFALAAFPMLFCGAASWPARLRNAAVFALVCAAAFALVCLPWSWRLWTEFGNPLFPFANEVFRSPDFTAEPLRHYRFVPESAWSGLLRPFAMALPVSMLHTDLRAPDVRYAALIIVAFCCAVTGLKGQLGLRAARSSIRIVAWPLALAVILAWILWLPSSGNSRYFVAGASASAVLLAWLLTQLHSQHRNLALALGACALLVQSVHLGVGMGARSAGLSWSRPWFDAELDGRFVREPYLYLSLDTLSPSFLVPRLAPGSGMMNLTGPYVLGPDGPGGVRSQKLIAQNIDRLRMIAPVRLIGADGSLEPVRSELYDAILRRYQLRIDQTDCVHFRVDGGWDMLLIDRGGGGPASLPPYLMVTCRVVRGNADMDDYRAHKARVDAVFDRVEDACPSLFRPRRTISEHTGTSWRRMYMNTDMQLWVYQGTVKYANTARRGSRVVIGTEDELRRDPDHLDCAGPSARTE